MTDIEKVRLLIGDVAGTQFTDAQIQAFLDMADDSVMIAAALALESWAATITDETQSERIGDYSYTKKTADNKLALAARYRADDASVPVLDIASMDLTSGSAITAEED